LLKKYLYKFETMLSLKSSHFNTCIRIVSHQNYKCQFFIIYFLRKRLAKSTVTWIESNDGGRERNGCL